MLNCLFWTVTRFVQLYNEIILFHPMAKCCFYPRASSILPRRIAKCGGWGGRFSLSVLWAVKAGSANSMEEGQTAIKGQQKARDEAGWLFPPASDQGSQTWGQWQLLMSSGKCRDHCNCDRERCVHLAFNHTIKCNVLQILLYQHICRELMGLRVKVLSCDCVNVMELTAFFQHRNWKSIFCCQY